jgi:hypothetical protein
MSSLFPGSIFLNAINAELQRSSLKDRQELTVALTTTMNISLRRNDPLNKLVVDESGKPLYEVSTSRRLFGLGTTIIDFGGQSHID